MIVYEFGGIIFFLLLFFFCLQGKTSFIVMHCSQFRSILFTRCYVVDLFKKQRSLSNYFNNVVSGILCQKSFQFTMHIKIISQTKTFIYLFISCLNNVWLDCIS